MNGKDLHNILLPCPHIFIIIMCCSVLGLASAAYLECFLVTNNNN